MQLLLLSLGPVTSVQQTQLSQKQHMSFRTISSDSRNTEPDTQKAPSALQNHTEDVISDEVKRKFSDNLYGQFDCASYTITRGYIDGKGKGIRLHYVKLEPYQKVGNLCIFHGYGEHSTDYLEIASFYANNGMVVHMLDLRGFGLSGGYKQHDSVTELYFDVETLLKRCEPALPTFIICNGLGSTLVMSLLTFNSHLPLAGIIVISPSTQIIRLLVLKLGKGRVPMAIGRPDRTQSHQSSALTNNNWMLKKIIEQGCDFEFVKLRILEQFMLRNAHRVTYPVLMYSGGANIFENVHTVEKYFGELGSRDKTYRCFSKGCHALLQDEECQSIKKHSIEWMLERVGGKIKAKMTPMMIPIHNIQRFQWKKILGTLGSLLLIIRLLKLVVKRMALK